MKTKLALLCFLAFILIPSFSAQAQQEEDTDAASNIFSRLQQYDPLQVVIETNYKSLRKDREDGGWQPAVFKIMMGDSIAFEQPVQVASRGKMRKKTCDFPPVKIRFFEKKPLDDSLADINELKLVVSCRNSLEDEQLVLRENLVYELYNLFTEESFRVKSTEIKFVTPGRKRSNMESVAFFIESEQEMAARLGARPLKPTVISPRVLDSIAYTRMCLFQYMVGNTDWGAYTRHNMKVIGYQDRRPLAIPYDFDYAGLVNADYAAPSADIPVRSVRERYYLGMCHNADLYQETFRSFLAKKEEILALCDQYPGLSYTSKQDAVFYLKEFFSILEDPKLAQKEIIESCNRRIIKK